MTQDILTRVRMTKLRTWENGRGLVGWQGVLTLDGTPVFQVTQEGDGGCNLYGPIPGAPTRARWRDTYTAIEAAAKAATGRKWEALDLLTAYMQNGDTAAQHVAAIRVEFGT